MHYRQILALCGASFALVLAPPTVALAAGGSRVTVRIEGKTRTLLAPTVVKTHTGSITKAGAPRGACSATSAAGALDTATHHHWVGKFETSDYFITSILGDTEPGKVNFWEIFVNNVAAQAGACEINLHRGDQLLFAVVPSTGAFEYPLKLTAPSHALVGHSFNVKVVWFNAKGVPKPLVRARVVGAGGVSATTNGHGIASISEPHAGTVALRASRKGYIRAAPVRVRVSG